MCQLRRLVSIEETTRNRRQTTQVMSSMCSKSFVIASVMRNVVTSACCLHGRRLDYNTKTLQRTNELVMLRRTEISTYRDIDRLLFTKITFILKQGQLRGWDKPLLEISICYLLTYSFNDIDKEPKGGRDVTATGYIHKLSAANARWQIKKQIDILIHASNMQRKQTNVNTNRRSSAIAEKLRDAPCQLKFCQLLQTLQEIAFKMAPNNRMTLNGTQGHRIWRESYQWSALTKSLSYILSEILPHMQFTVYVCYLKTSTSHAFSDLCTNISMLTHAISLSPEVCL